MPQNYLPKNIAGMVFYTPSEVGYEQTVAERLERWRAAQRLALGIETRTGPQLSQADVDRMKRER